MVNLCRDERDGQRITELSIEKRRKDIEKKEKIRKKKK